MIALLFTLVMANENYFSYNDWDYGDCQITKPENTEICKTKNIVCFRVTNDIDRNGKRYTKFACHKNELEY